MTEKLTEMTSAQLVELHNTLGGERIAGAWKRPKAELIAKIEALHAASTPKAVRAKQGAPEDAQGAPVETVGALIGRLLMDGSQSYADILAEVRAAHPEARTTVRSVASTASKMRREGLAVPTRMAKRRQ